MKTSHTLIRLVLLTACFIGGLLVHAAPIDADSKVLIIGPAANTHKTALAGLIAGDATASGLNITVDSFQTNDLWNSFFTAANGNFTRPNNSTPLQAKLNEGFDVILVNPGERHIRICPELHMEGVRMLERHVRNQGSRIFLMVPTFNPSYPWNPSRPSTSTDVKERVYRIADAFEFSAIPVGICWDTVLADGSISATDTSVAAPNTHAVNTYSTTIFSALFETSAAASSYRHGGISGAEFSQIAAHAHQTWQDALTATHYTGDYVGFFSPMPFVFDAANRPHYWSGASTEAMTMREMQSIYQRKGEHMVTGDTKTSPDWSKGYQFWVANDHLNIEAAPTVDRVDGALGLTYAVRDLEQLARAGLSRAENGGLNWYHRVDNPEWIWNGYVLATYTYEPGPKVSKVPNMIGYTRYYADFPNQRAKKYGDGHLNDNLTMMQSAMIYTMVSGGQNPLEDVTNLNGWTGPQRYAAALGYATVMGIGRLQKLEMAPVAVGKPRYQMTANADNWLTLPGYDFDGLPLTVEILTPPAHGSLVPSGNNFTYTPDTDFSGIDTVTYRVSNGTDTSHPLTVYLPVTPYIPSPVTGTVFFEDNFDDRNIGDWNKSHSDYVAIVTSASSNANKSPSLVDGFKTPYDGTAGIMLGDDAGWANVKVWKGVDTTVFENLLLTIRVGSGSRTSEGSSSNVAKVEWYDGSTWHTVISHGHSYLTNRLMFTYEVSLPAAAAMNPDFRLRLSRTGINGVESYFDSIRLSGDVVQLPPVANDLAVEVATNTPWPITLEASDINSDDTLSYAYSQPSHGTLSGTAPNLTYTSDTAYSGPDSFTYTANDGTSDSNVATVTINVRNNTAPVVNAGDNQTTIIQDDQPWTPDQISLTAWYDASDSSTITENSGAVTQWADKSGNGHDLSQSTGSQQPTTGIRTVNGLNVLDHDGGDYMHYSNFPIPSSGDVSIFIVPVIDSINSEYDAIFSFDSSADFQFDAGSDSQFNARVRGDGMPTLDFSGGPYTGPAIFNAVFHKSAGTIDGYVDGTQRGISASYTTALASTQILRSFGNRAGSQFPDGAVAEILLIEDCSPATRQKTEGYLAHKWGLVNNLPSDHPFKTNPPGASSATLILNGSATDGENDPLSIFWTQISGPGSVIFADASAVNTEVSFLAPGTYVLRLSADDGWEQTTSDITITVTETMVDSDNDGLDDDWELAHFDTLGDTDGTGDADGDGVKDFWEFMTGTDPNVADANLLALDAGPSAYGPASVFKWTVKDGFVAGQHYQVLYSTDLSGWTPLPQEHYTLTPTVVNGMNEVEMDVTYDYGPHIFITLDQP